VCWTRNNNTGQESTQWLEEKLSVAVVQQSREDDDTTKFLEAELSSFSTMKGISNMAEHQITMKNDKPIKQRYYPKTPKVQGEVNEGVPHFQERAVMSSLSSDFAKIVKHLNDLLCVRRSEARHVADPVLACPDKPFILQTDASVYGIGAILTLETERGDKVISYSSRTLYGAEKNYSTTERKCLAIVWAIRKLKPYLEGYWSCQYLSINPKKSLPHPLKRPQTAQVCGTHNFHARLIILTEMYWPRQYLSIDPKKI